jgi:hypothetical protein
MYSSDRRRSTRILIAAHLVKSDPSPTPPTPRTAASDPVPPHPAKPPLPTQQQHPPAPPQPAATAQPAQRSTQSHPTRSRSPHRSTRAQRPNRLPPTLLLPLPSSWPQHRTHAQPPKGCHSVR